MPERGLLSKAQTSTACASAAAVERLAGQFGLPIARLSAEVRIAPEVLALVPRVFAARHGLLPLAADAESLQVVVSDPLATAGVDELSQQLGRRIDIALATSAQIAEAIERCYGSAPATSHGEDQHDEPRLEVASATPTPTTMTAGGATAMADDEADAPIIRFVQSIIAQAVRRRASDIHWEPLERRFRVRYRIDGVLVEVENPPKRLQLAVVSRIKIMANISIAEKRLPQDGRIAITIDGQALDLRVSTLPTAHGESVVMRILDKASLRRGLPELGFAADDQARFERLLALPDGMVLVTGPTGSGKTTTLYACLQRLNLPDRKLITVEDPIEYQLTGINQVPVRPEAGVTFAAALRAILRQAPNIVMIGEIRDLETAEIAIHAALTGHLVFSTLHTNDAVGAVTRLIDLGVKPFLVASALRAVLAQRLVRKTCEKCAHPYEPPTAFLAALNIPPAVASAARFRRGTGCPACLRTGYRGRTGIFELLEIDDELQRLIHARSRTALLRAHARAAGMRSLAEDGARQASAGLTTVEEVVSITVGDASQGPTFQ
ncbi:type II secretion system protein E [Opitutus terrae PB90-1]|uniref:Type II secretion system protein E n=2 Tax=Opitutus terrae TaxID=107709 RepID=B1ZZG0_OPITP|nr:type II secretion system protein E [Opitutus terrae PB90-1]